MLRGLRALQRRKARRKGQRLKKGPTTIGIGGSMMDPFDPIRLRKLILRMFEDLEGMFEEMAKENMKGAHVRGYIFRKGPEGTYFKEIGGEEKVEREEVVDAREPLVDIFEEDTGLRVLVELPGAKKEDIVVEPQGPQMVVVKTKDGRFYKRIALPKAVDAKKAESKYKNGVLELFLPYGKRKGKRIKVE